MVCKKCNFCLLFFSFSRSGAHAVQFLAAKDNFLSVFRAKKETTFCGSIVRKPDYIRVCNFLPGWFVGKGGGGAGGRNSLEPCSFLNSCVATAARNR